MRRREFISLLGGAAAWPIAARAQQPARMRRVGMIIGYVENDPEAKLRVAAFARGMHELGWTEGYNVRIDYRYPAADEVRIRAYAAELVALAPDVIFAINNAVVAALQRETSTLPIVFAGVGEPVDSRFVASLERPGGIITGFSNFEASVSGKWLETLKEVAPAVRRIGVVLHRETLANIVLLRLAEAAAPRFGVSVTGLDVHYAREIESAVTAFAAESGGGLIVIPHPVTNSNRDLLTGLAARYRLPAIYPFDYYIRGGGLISYGFDQYDQVRRAATYVDRILKGAKPADLPVQQPVKFQMIVNLRSAKVIGLTIPEAFLALADEVIE